MAQVKVPETKLRTGFPDLTCSKASWDAMSQVRDIPGLGQFVSLVGVQYDMCLVLKRDGKMVTPLPPGARVIPVRRTSNREVSKGLESFLQERAEEARGSSAGGVDEDE